jgi:hypothetical protein
MACNTADNHSQACSSAITFGHPLRLLHVQPALHCLKPDEESPTKPSCKPVLNLAPFRQTTHFSHADQRRSHLEAALWSEGCHLQTTSQSPWLRLPCAYHNIRGCGLHSPLIVRLRFTDYCSASISIHVLRYRLFAPSGKRYTAGQGFEFYVHALVPLQRDHVHH